MIQGCVAVLEAGVQAVLKALVIQLLPMERAASLIQAG